MMVDLKFDLSLGRCKIRKKFGEGGKAIPKKRGTWKLRLKKSHLSHELCSCLERYAPSTQERGMRKKKGKAQKSPSAKALGETARILVKKTVIENQRIIVTGEGLGVSETSVGKGLTSRGGRNDFLILRKKTTQLFRPGKESSRRRE